MEPDTEIALSLKGHGNAEYDTEMSKTAVDMAVPFAATRARSAQKVNFSPDQDTTTWRPV